MESSRAPTDAELELYRLAEEVASNAYAPHSKFPVGAALRTTSGAVFTGTNFENASFGLTICAERGAIGRGVAEGMVPQAARLDPDEPAACVELIAVATPATTGSPCGACRQVLAEFAAADMRVIYRREGLVSSVLLSELLADPFVL